jgi:hypothetical protein
MAQKSYQAMLVADAPKNYAEAALKSSGADTQLAQIKYILPLLAQAAVGPGTGFLSRFQTLVKESGHDFSLGGFAEDPAARQVLDKELVNLGIINFDKSLQDSGGGSARFSGLLANLNRESMSPNVDLTRKAIEKMLQYYAGQYTYQKNEWGPNYTQAVGAGGVNPLLYAQNYPAAYPQTLSISNYIQHMDHYGNVYPHRDPQGRVFHKNPDGNAAYVNPLNNQDGQLVGPQFGPY